MRISEPKHEDQPYKKRSRKKDDSSFKATFVRAMLSTPVGMMREIAVEGLESPKDIQSALFAAALMCGASIQTHKTIRGNVKFWRLK